MSVLELSDALSQLVTDNKHKLEITMPKYTMWLFSGLNHGVKVEGAKRHVLGNHYLIRGSNFTEAGKIDTVDLVTFAMDKLLQLHGLDEKC